MRQTWYLKTQSGTNHRAAPAPRDPFHLAPAEVGFAWEGGSPGYYKDLLTWHIWSQAAVHWSPWPSECRHMSSRCTDEGTARKPSPSPRPCSLVPPRSSQRPGLSRPPDRSQRAVSQGSIWAVRLSKLKLKHLKQMDISLISTPPGCETHLM
jgi:hypothetical protein